jgi:hypothetical protein
LPNKYLFQLADCLEPTKAQVVKGFISKPRAFTSQGEKISRKHFEADPPAPTCPVYASLPALLN